MSLGSDLAGVAAEDIAPAPVWSARQREILAQLQVSPYRWRDRAGAGIDQLATEQGTDDQTAAVEVGSSAARDDQPITAAAAEGWSLLATPQWRQSIESLRWYRQLSLFADELPCGETATRSPVILLGDRRLPLDGNPPRPSPGVKRELYLALRGRKPRG